jgi:hypothetical protein
MILALLHVVAAGTPQVPTATPIPPAIAAATVPVQVQITETHFMATSHVDRMQWLVFANEELGLRSVRGLAPRAQALLPIVEGSAEGMSFEVVLEGDDGRRLVSGTFDCERLTGDELFVTRSGHTLVGWIPRHGGRSLTRAAAGESVVPGGQTFARAEAAATHVPVPTPRENRKRDKARRLKRKKLPPV